jgi:hypothetical protein
MVRVKASLLVFCLCALLALPGGSARGMEFTVAVSNTVSYLYYSQMGSNGFFGPYNVDRSVSFAPGAPFLPVVANPGDAAVANAWLGTGLGIVSGADASSCSVSTSLFPEFRANDAISIIGIYRAGNAELGQFPGAAVSFANGEWLQL